MNYDEVIARLIEERKKRMTQAELAKKTGLFQTYISKFETSKSGTYETLEKYAEGVGYKLSIRMVDSETGEVVE